MEVIPSIIYHYLSIIFYLGFHHSLRSYHFQSYVLMKVYTTVYLNYKFLGFHTYALNEENSEDLSNVFKDGKMIYFTRTWLRRYDHLVKKNENIFV